MRKIRILTGFIILFAYVAPVMAQTAVVYDERVLTQLYQAYLKKDQKDAYLEQRITSERERIRKVADLEVLNLVTPPEKEDVSGSAISPLDRQLAIVQTLEEKEREHKVDLDLLTEEEKKYYSPLSGTGANTELKLTQSYPELLAKKAILEERINAFTASLALQNDRLYKLQSAQRYEQFAFILSVLTYGLIIAGTIIIERFIRRTMVERIEDKNRRYRVAKIISGLFYLAVILGILNKLFTDYPGAVSSLAIIGAGIAVALQDVIKDVVGWMIIIQRRLFTLGDRIRVAQFTGDVVDIGLLRTTLMHVDMGGEFSAHERTDRLLYLPNSLILREQVMNHTATSDFASAELTVTITFQSNWEKARDILEEIVKDQSSQYTEQARYQQRHRTAFFFTTWEVSAPEVHVDIANKGVDLTLKFLCPLMKERQIRTTITELMLKKFKEAGDITIAEKA